MPSAHAADVHLRTGADDRAVEPGRLVSRHLVIENRAGTPIEVSEEAELPSGWVLVLTADPVFQLEPSATVFRLLSFSIPPHAPSGPNRVRYVLRDRRTQQVVLERDLEVQVLATARLEIAWSEAPTSVVAGDAVRFSATLVNRGNRPMRVVLQSSVTPAVPVPPSRTVDVARGATETVELEVLTDGGTTRRSLLLVQVRGEASADDGVPIPIRPHSVTVEVIPRQAPSFDPYVRLPTQWTTTAAWETGREPGVQTEIKGRGALDESGQHRADFILRGPAAASPRNSLRSQEEYGASLASTNLQVHLGDRRYEVSPLLKNPALARGMGLDWREGAMGVGGYVAEQVQRVDRRQERSAYLSWSPGALASFRYQALQIDRDPGKGDARTLHSLLSTWQWRHHLTLELEGAVDPEEGFTDGAASRISAKGSLGSRGGWHADRTVAGSRFEGATQGTETSQAGLFVQLSEPLRLGAEWRDHRAASLASGEGSRGASHDSSWKAGPRYRFEEGTTLRLDLGLNQRERSQGTNEFRSTEPAVGVAVGHSFRTVDVELTQEVAIPREAGTETDRGGEWVSRSGLTLLWRPDSEERQTYTASVQAEAADAAMERAASLQASVSGAWRVGRASRYSLGVSHRFSSGSVAGPGTTLQGRADWTLRNRHELGVSARVGQEASSRSMETAVSLAYRIPLSVPVGRRRGFGTIQGTVRDGDQPAGAGVERVIVRLNTGDTVVTDKGGRFVFSGLKAGTYTVSVESRSLGFGRVMADLATPNLVVKDDSVATVDLRVVSAAVMEVVVTLFEEPIGLPAAPARAEAGDRHRAVGPLVGEVVELTNGQETLRRRTGASGAAVFAGIRPGPWSLRIYDEALPALHAVEKPTREISLQPGARHAETVRVLPRKRRLQFIDQGT